MTKKQLKKMATEYLKEADDYINYSENSAENVEEEDPRWEADYFLKKSIANSLMAIACLMGMNENLLTYGDFIRERREEEQ